MNKSHLTKLPLGTYHLTNGIYNYTLEKYIWDDPVYNKEKNITYRIREKGSLPFSPAITLDYEDLEEVYDNYKKFKFKGFVAHILVFGLSVMAPCRFISELEFVPRGSFKEFINRTSGVLELCE